MVIQAYGKPHDAQLIAAPTAGQSFLPFVITAADPELADPFHEDFTLAAYAELGPGKTEKVPIRQYGLVQEAATLNPWFELMHVLPRHLRLGRVLSATTIPMAVHNAYRHRDVLWSSFTNGAGQGVNLVGTLPPITIPKQSTETDLDLIITMIGPPLVDDDLGFIFEFDVGTVTIPIEFQRLVFFPFIPEAGYTEELVFLTDVMEAKNGTEQRHSVRVYPRQKFDFSYRLLDSELTRLHNALLSRPGGTYGIPLWHEQSEAVGTHAIGATVVNLTSTAFRDFRVGGVAVIFEDEFTYDIFLVDAMTGTTLTPRNPIVNAYTNKAIVMPVRYGQINARQSGSRYRLKMADIEISFNVTDVGIDLASAAAFSTFKSKVFIDDDNAVDGGRANDSIEASRVEVFDSVAGPVSQESLTAFARSLGHKGWYPQGAQKLWEVRALLHYLRGRQVSFWIATRREDLIPTAGFTSGESSMTVEATGLGAMVDSGYRTAIRITLTDGSTLLRDILSPSGVVVSLDGRTEVITLTTTWSATVALASIARIEFIQKVRLDSDTIQISYEPGVNGARVTVPLRSVLE